ncbi:MAG: outer membrane protein assembly factor BamB family protein [Planctomycetota bacterium]
MKSNKDRRQSKFTMVFFISILIIGLLLSATPVMAADWPNFRNENSNSGNTSETINLPLTLQWHSAAPSVEENGVVVSNGIAYMSTDDNKLYAFEVATGAVVPGYPVATAFNYGAPAVDAVNGRVYVLASGTFYAFNLDGTSNWTAAVGATGNNYNQGPIIDEGYVYFKAGNFLRKFDSNGTLQWAAVTSGINTQPAIMGNYVYVNSEGGQIRKYLKSDGSEVVAGGFPMNTATSHASITTVNGKIFHKADQLYAYNANDGSLLWTAPAGGDSGPNWFYDSPAVSNGVVYVYGWDAKVYAYDANTGAAMAGYPSIALSAPSDRNWSSPTVAGDLVFVGAGTSQNLTVLGAAGSASPGIVLDEHKTFSIDPQGFDLCSPVISDGVVFALLDGGGLYAFFGAGVVWTGGAITINSGDNCTESQDITLSIDRGSNTDADQMRLSEDPFFGGAAWEAYAATKPWTLSAGFGIKTVYVQFRDSQTLQESNVFNDQIEYSESCADETDISVSKSDDVDPVAPDDEIVYTIVVTNNGPDAAGPISVVDTLPIGVTGLSAAASVGVVQFISAGAEVQWDLPGLAAGESATGTITVRVNSDTTGVITNTVVATIDNDPDLNNNTASEDTTVGPGNGPPVEVGGDVYPANKFAMLAPWLALAAALIIGSIIAVRRRRAS